MNSVLYWLAVWFGAGLSPKAPGTMGSLAALPFAWVITLHFGALGLLLASAAVFLIGIWASGAVIKRDGDPDPGEVVIDEVAGQWLALIPAGLDPVLFAVGFFAFRLFDIWKPWPIGWADRSIKGGPGVMADDLLAGACAAAIVWLVGTHWPGSAPP